MHVKRFFTAALLLVATGCSSGPRVGHEAPTFEAVDVRGDPVTSTTNEGQTLVLYFFGHW